MNAELCSGFRKNDWEALTKRLDGGDESAWIEAAGVFERRIRERFISSIDALVIADTGDKVSSADSAHTQRCIPGFSIMALCCLLIETLQAFREGNPEVVAPEGPCSFPSKPCIKPPSGTNQKFRSFLRLPAFGGAFDDRIAKHFLTGIRNGILHDAETRRWVIWREEPAKKIVAEEENGLALNRTLFYAAVKREFESYLNELRDPNNENLRKVFKSRMDRLHKEA